MPETELIKKLLHWQSIDYPKFATVGAEEQTKILKRIEYFARGEHIAYGAVGSQKDLEIQKWARLKLELFRQLEKQKKTNNQLEMFQELLI